MTSPIHYTTFSPHLEKRFDPAGIKPILLNVQSSH